jgi:outer membrane protein OmpA-like peptidoglycan-associated protein
MKYRLLISALTLSLGSQLAFADEDPSDEPVTSDATTSVDVEPGEAKLYFDTDSADVDDPNADDELTKLAKYARCHPKEVIIIEGHADRRGTSKHNARLSAERAVAVRAKLIELGARPTQLVIVVHGETQPAMKSLAGNRRVTARVGTEPIEPDAG